MHPSVKNGSVSVSGDLTVSGNLTISGNTTTLNTETLAVEDNKVVLNSSVTATPSADAGIEIERGTSDNVELRWNETTDKWQFSNDGTTYVNIASTTDLSNHESDTTNIHGIANTAELVTLSGAQNLTNKTLDASSITGVLTGSILVGNSSNVAAAVAVSGDVTLASNGNVQIASGAIVNDDINGNALIAVSKLASGSPGQILMANGSNVPTYTTVSGDVTLASNGSVQIASGAIYDGDINGNALIQWSKMTSLLSGSILVGNSSNVATPVAVSGDITLDSNGIAQIASGAIYDSDINANALIQVSKLYPGTAGQVLLANAGGIPTFTTVSGDVTLASNGSVQIASGAIYDGDINGNALIQWSKMTSLLSGSILVGNSSNVATPVAVSGDITLDSNGIAQIASGAIYDSDINANALIQVSKLYPGTAGQVLLANAGGIPTFTTLSGDVTLASNGAVTIAANSVALGTDTTGNYMVNVAGGTGVTVTHTPGEGSTATIAIGQAVATNSEVTFAGIKVTSVIEPVTVSATAATGTIALDAASGTTYYTSNASANFVVNLRWNSGTSLNDKLAVNEMTTTSFMVTNGASAFYPTTVQVNGTVTGVTTRWQGGTAPTSGNANSVDMYTFTVVQTAANTFSVFAAQTRFA